MGGRSRAAAFLLAIVLVAPTLPAAAQVGGGTPAKMPLPKPVLRAQADGKAGMEAAVPLPVPRPEASDTPPVRAEADRPGMEDVQFGVCMAHFSERGESLPPPEPAAQADEACAIPGPLTFMEVKLKEGGEVRLESPVTVRCSLALVIAEWVREDLAPIARQSGTALVRLVGVGGHACRTRNGQPGAQVSEHASGNAFDLLALEFKDGRKVELWQEDAATRDIRAQVRETACARFTTVLGPGADGAHANHVHLDLRERSNDYRMCQWEVK